MNQQTLTLVVLFALVLAVVWLSISVQRLHADIAPLATSPLANSLAGIG